ncbi:MAG: hypothetical protein JSR37_02975 [Verrucomicrobia bacterium]|nr:hypothetical protein [Verrucomicrobiota bacterium]MBS0637512.1 hypothetical protein [Verrucomicrobiota bacterium]
MFTKVTEEAIGAYQQGALSKLDALVGNNGCEVHSFTLLTFAKSEELQQECSDVATKLSSLQQLDISTKMRYLIQSRLLTVTKRCVYNDAGFGTAAYEQLETDAGSLRKISRLKIEDHILSELVLLTQVAMAESSISFTSAAVTDSFVRSMLSGENLFSYGPTYVSKFTNVRRVCTPKLYSSAYYNTKALLGLIKETNSPLVLKKIAKKDEAGFSVIFDGNFQLIKRVGVDPKTPVVVCMGYFSHDRLTELEEHGVDKVILAATALEDQFVPNHAELFQLASPEAQRELELQAELAMVHSFQKLLYVDHFYASTLEMENVDE